MADSTVLLATTNRHTSMKTITPPNDTTISARYTGVALRRFVCILCVASVFLMYFGWNTYMSDDQIRETVSLNVPSGRVYLWQKLHRSLTYLYTHHLDDYDWFFKADDDTYVIVENLRRLLIDYDPRQALYLGCRFHPHVTQGFMSGGAGFVMSREAVRLIVEKGMTNASICSLEDQEMSDVKIAECFQRLGVNATDTRDLRGRHRFLPDNPQKSMQDSFSKSNSFYYYPKKKGKDCCSDLAITFHYVQHEQMQVLDYLIYNLSPFGVQPSWLDDASNPDSRLPFNTPTPQQPNMPNLIGDNSDASYLLSANNSSSQRQNSTNATDDS